MAGVEAPAAATAADRLSDPITRWHSTDAAACSPRKAKSRVAQSQHSHSTVTAISQHRHSTQSQHTVSSAITAQSQQTVTAHSHSTQSTAPARDPGEGAGKARRDSKRRNTTHW